MNQVSRQLFLILTLIIGLFAPVTNVRATPSAAPKLIRAAVSAVTQGAQGSKVDQGLTRGSAKAMYAPRDPMRVIYVGWTGNSLGQGYATKIAHQAGNFSPNLGLWAWNVLQGASFIGDICGISGGRMCSTYYGCAGGRTLRDVFGIGQLSSTVTYAGYPSTLDARLERTLLPFYHDVVGHVGWGVNEADASTALYHTLPEFQGLFRRLIAATNDTGARQIVVGPPINTNTGYNTVRADHIQKWQALWLFANWEKTYCAANGIPFIDTRTVVTDWDQTSGATWNEPAVLAALALADDTLTPAALVAAGCLPATQPAWLTGMSDDGTHWRTSLGKRTVGTKFVAAVDGIFGVGSTTIKVADQVNSDGSDPGGNIVGTPWINRGDAGGYPTGWSKSGTGVSGVDATFSIVAPTAGDQVSTWMTTHGATGAMWGKLQRLSNDNTKTYTVRQAITLTPGQRYRFSGIYKTEGYNDNICYADASLPKYSRVRLNITDSVYGQQLIGPVESCTWNTGANGWYFHYEFEAPPNVSSAYVEVVSAGQSASATDTATPTIYFSGFSIAPIKTWTAKNAKAAYTNENQFLGPTTLGGQLIYTGQAITLTNPTVSTVSATGASVTTITTSAAHNLTSNQWVRIASATGSTAINGIWPVNVTSSTAFTIQVANSSAYTGSAVITPLIDVTYGPVSQIGGSATGCTNLLPASPPNGTVHWVSNSATATWTLDGNGANIEGSSTASISSVGLYQYRFDGTKWKTPPSGGGGGSGDFVNASNNTVSGNNTFSGTSGFSNTVTTTGTLAVNATQTLKQQTITLNGGSQTISVASGGTVILAGSTAGSTIAWPASSTVDTWFRIIDQTTGAWTRSANGGTIDGLSASQVIPAGGGNGAFHATASTTWVTLATNPSGAVSKGAIVGGDTITGTTTETVMGNVKTFAAGQPQAGEVWEVYSIGLLTTDSATAGTLTLRLRWGGVGGTEIAINDSVTSVTTSGTNGLVRVSAMVEFITVGSSGTVRADGHYSYQKQATAGLTMGGYFGEPGVSSTTIDTTTASKDLCFTVKFSQPGASNLNSYQARQVVWRRVK